MTKRRVNLFIISSLLIIVLSWMLLFNLLNSNSAISDTPGYTRNTITNHHIIGGK